jgi:hypothetical protein
MIFSGVNISGMSASVPVIVTGDPYYANVALLLHADGTNGSTTFIDNSPVPKTVTAFADAQISTSVFKYGTGSAKFDGTGDYLTVLSPLFAVGTGDFTVEGWAYLTAYTNGGIFSTWTVGMDQGIWLGFDLAGKINFYIGGAYGSGYNNGIVSAATVPLNTWTYVAAVRASSATYLYLNGERIGTSSTTRNITNTNGVIGRVYWGHDSNYLTGYIDDVRVTCGVARYGASDFTPPTAPFPNS